LALSARGIVSEAYGTELLSRASGTDRGFGDRGIGRQRPYSSFNARRLGYGRASVGEGEHPRLWITWRLTNHDYAGARSDGYGRLLDRFRADIDSGTRPGLTQVEDTMQVMRALPQHPNRRSDVRPLSG